MSNENHIDYSTLPFEKGQVWEATNPMTGATRRKIVAVVRSTIFYQRTVDLGCGWSPPYPMDEPDFRRAILQSQSQLLPAETEQINAGGRTDDLPLKKESTQ